MSNIILSKEVEDSISMFQASQAISPIKEAKDFSSNVSNIIPIEEAEDSSLKIQAYQASYSWMRQKILPRWTQHVKAIPCKEAGDSSLKYP